MGLTYKENVPDTRESPVKEMVKELQEFGVEVYGYDPLLTNEEIERFGVTALDNLDKKADCIIMAVAHNEFKEMQLGDLGRRMNDVPILIDVRGIVKDQKAEEKGFYYMRL